tara:strand:+ start:24 stop:383 length:360 start_codon:yes stop_codon:yes gene_type:complete
MTYKIFYTFLGILFSLNVYAEDFDDQKYQNLIEEVRCMVCQNQNIAESEAPLAIDLRQKIKKMLIEGKSEIYIKNYLTDRYSDFILYDPPKNTQTALLWIGPVLFLIIITYLFYSRRER